MSYRNEDRIIELAGALIALVIVGLFIAGCLWAGVLFNRYKCAAEWDNTYQTQYGFWSGCRVKIDDKWVPAQNVREGIGQ